MCSAENFDGIKNIILQVGGDGIGKDDYETAGEIIDSMRRRKK